MNILILGASGFLGSTLVYKLEKKHNLVLITRSKKRIITKNHPIMTWSELEKNPEVLTQIDCIVNLCGQSILGFWTKRYKMKLLNSRVVPLQKIATLLENSNIDIPIVSASGIGVSGYQDPISHDQLPQALSEQGERGNPYYLQEIGDALEQALPDRLQKRACYLRFGVVLDPHGGSLPLMMLPHHLSLGAVPGPGSQPISWVSLSDAISSIEFAIDHALVGPYNIVAQTLTAHNFHHQLASAMHRRCFLRLPQFILKYAGQCISETLLKGQHISSQKIQATGFSFQITNIKSLLSQDIH